ncbi:hypothetical protein ACPCG0_01385 [Propionibacteriaceae bacterium Y1923]|uniref:hypothetical protein n=1 Tax=Aestuariimicrobium sp. Y1814 TaxID=3418742 RepID=UPI003C1BF811
MKFNLFGWEFECELPADPVGFIKGKVIELLNYMGYEWPVTDTGVLDSWAGQWDSLNARLQAYLDDMEGAVTTITSSNEGDVPVAVAAYLRGEDSSMHSIETIAAAAPVAAQAYRGASTLITGLRAYVIGQIILDAVSIAAAIISGGASAAVSILAKKGATMLINLAIDQAINDLLGA